MFDNKGRYDKHSFEPAEAARILAFPGYVILGTVPGGNSMSAVIERSFSMDESIERVLFWFVRPDMQADRVFKNCEHYRAMFSKGGKEYKIWDVRDPELPILINWEEWLWANSSSEKTLSGVRDKFRSRNPEFKMKDQPS